jgi:Tfp pilus assembly protein PilX
MKTLREKGIALIVALILTFIMSVMAISLMFISQTETWSSLNYRLTSQARDGAEAGINSAANFIMNNYTPPAPGSSTDPLNGYNYTSVYPVQVGAANNSGHDVYLSANTSTRSANYPLSSVQSAFNAAGKGKGSITSGNTTVNYATYAHLLSMTKLNSTISGSHAVVQTWEITSDGTIGGIRAADVEVSAILEQTVVPTFTYAAFATSNGCSALTFGGGGSTDSYDSSTYSGSGTPTIALSNGNVGTNGNLSTSGSTTTINGNLSTPRTGTGSCSSSNVTAWTDSSGHVTGSIIELPQPVVYPTPPAPNPVPPTSSANAITLNNHAGDCGGISGCSYDTTGSPACASGDFCLQPGTCPPANPGAGNSGPGVYGDVTVKGNVHLKAGCYNINSLTENGGGALYIDSGTVTLNIAGTGQTTPLTLTGGGVINTVSPNKFDPMNFQILYAGTGTIKLAGGASAVGLMYAPNASYSLTGGSHWYGALIGATLTDMGGANIHYDRRLSIEDFVPGNWMLESFTWKKD